MKVPCTTGPSACSKMSEHNSQEGDDDQEAPAYFKRFVTEFRTEVADIKRVAEETRDECRNEVQQTKAQAQKNARDIGGLREHARLRDKCEVLVLGLPLEWESSHEDAAAKLVTALDLRSSILRDADYRVWDPRSNPNRNGKATGTKAFVIEFDTAKHRDKFVAASSKLSYMTARHVFGVGPFSAISIRPLWPDSVHNLMMKAVRVSKAQSWPRPVVDNLVVCIRTGRSRSSIPIFSEEDLHAVVADYGTNMPSNAPAFPTSQGASRYSSMSGQVPMSATANTMEPMEGVVSGSALAAHATLPLSQHASTASVAGNDVPHPKVA